MTENKSAITLLNRSLLTISNVEKVIEANNTMVLLTVDTDSCKICGKDLTLEKLDIPAKKAEISGTVNSITFGKKPQKLLSKLFSSKTSQ